MRTNIQIGEPVEYTPRPVGKCGSDALVDLTMREVEWFFHEKTTHRPSKEMIEALEAIPRTVSKIVQGTAPAKYHLCQLDTGVGYRLEIAGLLDNLQSEMRAAEDARRC